MSLILSSCKWLEGVSNLSRFIHRLGTLAGMNNFNFPILASGGLSHGKFTNQRHLFWKLIYGLAGRTGLIYSLAIMEKLINFHLQTDREN